MSNTKFNINVYKQVLTRQAAKMAACREELNALDGQLGDGDLGVTLTRGMDAIMAEIDTLPEDLGEAFMQCAQAFTRSSGSTFGTLVATALMAAAKLYKGKTEFEWSEVSSLLQAAIDNMKKRGKAELGDKTVLDALQAARSTSEGLNDPQQIALACNTAVGQAVEEFRPRACKRGRARVLADRSTGLDDPGMMAFKRIVEACAGK